MEYMRAKFKQQGTVLLPFLHFAVECRALPSQAKGGYNLGSRAHDVPESIGGS